MSENENTEVGQTKLGCPCPPCPPPFPPCPPRPWDDKGMAAAIAALTKLYHQLSEKVESFVTGLPEVKRDLAEEVANRENGDNVLASRISTETEERKADVASVKSRFGNIESAVSINSTKIADEIRIRAAMDSELHGKVIAEAEFRESTDKDLQRQINDITGGSGSLIGRLEAEENARREGDEALARRATALETWKTTAEADIEHLKQYGSKEYTDAKISELRGEVIPRIESGESRLQTAEETVAAVSSALTETQGKVNAVETKANTLEQNLATAKNDIRTNTEGIVQESQARESADEGLDERISALESWKATVESRLTLIIGNIQSLDARVTKLEEGGGGSETGPFASVNMVGSDGNAYAVSVIPEEGTDEVVTDVTRLFVGGAGAGTAKAHYALQGNDGRVYKFAVIKPEDEDATTEVTVYSPMDGERVLPYIDFYCTDGHTYRMSVVKPEDEDATTNLSRIL